MVNTSIIQGFVSGATLDRDKNGSPYVFFDLCHIDYKKEKNWFKCFFFGGVAEVMSKRLKEGRNIVCQGHIRSRQENHPSAKPEPSLSIIVQRIDFIQTEQGNDIGGEN